MKREAMIDLQNQQLVVGVDLGGTQLRVAVLQGANLLSRVRLLTGEDPSPSRIIPRIYSAIQQALDEANTRLDQIVGIGIGVAGPLDSHTGIVFAPANLPGWDHVPLREIFEEHYRIPVFVENDANVAALGEYLFGAGNACQNMVYLTISTGIGSGVIVNGRIMGGTSGTAGELGHMTVDWRGERCNCGNIGCLESIASGTAIARRARKAVTCDIDFFTFVKNEPEHDRSVSGQEHGTVYKPGQLAGVDAQVVARAAKAGVPAACTIITEAAEALGIGLVNIIHIFNPDMIILGGGVTKIGSLLLDPAMKVVEERAMKVPFEAVHIVQAQLGPDVGLIGAGALIYHNMEKSGLLQREGMVSPVGVLSVL